MPKKILIIDDEPHLVKIFESRLKANGYDVVYAFDGQEGLDKAKQEKPDLIILDHRMPKLDGYEVYKILRSDAAYPNIPIVMLTASGTADWIKTGMEKGMDAYITKPVKPDLLLGIIEGLLR